MIEALHCGLPALVYNDGGHPEIVGKGGAWFNQPEEIPELLDRIVQDYTIYQEQIRVPSMEEVGQRYYEFMYGIYEAVQRGEYMPKQLSLWGYWQVLEKIGVWKLSERLGRLQRCIEHKE